MKHDMALSAPLNVIGICAGVGGLELGLQLALHHRGQAVRGVCYVEREAAAVASLVASMEAGWLHPAPVWSDARTFDGRRFRGCVDIVTSGDPCQGNSVAGKRRGELDDRWLLDRAIDIFDQSGAPTFFRENVPGNADGQLAVAIPALERLGCRVAVGIFSSAETGNTMRRERFFMLARRPVASASGEDDGRRGVYRPGQGDAADTGRGSSGEFVGTGDHLGIANGRRSGKPELQRGGKLGFLAEGDGASGNAHGERGPMARPAGRGRGRKDHTRQPSGIASQAGQRLPPAVIPGPADNRGWIDVLDRWPELQPALSKEEAESHLRRGIDAVADRIERLRATGNGVDPVAAAYAFLRLDALLDDTGAAATGNVLKELAA